MECGKKFYTVGAAERASFGSSGCPGCGGSDIEPYYGIGKTVGKFGKEIKHHHHKTAIKKAHTHIIGTKPHKQKVVSAGIVPRNIEIYGKKLTLNDEDREQWVSNDEGLYSCWRQSRQSKRQFVKENRAELTRIIMAYLNREPKR
jgi:hypothetical protein